MFARAAIIGRVARERAEARRNALETQRAIKKKTPAAPLRQRCFIPMMRGPCSVLVTGTLMIVMGAVMCNFAFHAEKLSTGTEDIYLNGTRVKTIDKVKYQALESLKYIGPSIMGSGVFIIIIACVVLLDKRDKILKDYVNGMLEAQQEISRELSYRAVTTNENILKPSSIYDNDSDSGMDSKSSLMLNEIAPKITDQNFKDEDHDTGFKLLTSNGHNTMNGISKNCNSKLLERETCIDGSYESV